MRLLTLPVRLGYVAGRAALGALMPSATRLRTDPGDSPLEGVEARDRREAG